MEIIRILYGEYNKARCDSGDFGDAIWGQDREPEEIGRFTLEEEEVARKEFLKYRSRYELDNNEIYAEEYALVFSDIEYDEEGNIEYESIRSRELAKMDKDSMFSLITHGSGIYLCNSDIAVDLGDNTYFIPIKDIIQPVFDRIENDKNAPEWTEFYEQYLED